MLFLGRDDVEAVMDPDALIDAMGPALADLSAGRVSAPNRTAAVVAAGDTFTGLLDMPAYVPSAGALTSKLVSVFPGNTGTGRPVRQAIIAVFDPETGAPAAVLDGAVITAARTAACSALSTRLLARANSEVLAVLGTGVQARAHARFVSRVRPFRQVRIAGGDRERARAAAAELSDELGVEVVAMPSYPAATDGADVVCGATFTVEPAIRRAWISPGTHLTSVGYHPNGREVDDETIAEAMLIVESRAAALQAVPPNRDLAGPLERGLLTLTGIHAELGELVAGTATGRTDDTGITLYKSVGVAVQDAAAAALILAAARARGVGQRVSL
ncbi:ornithine cyclodeaminase family protein [Nocardia veterana]|uniref:Ornithine cyclodeaminase family protein n=1 Tax=Nocardia veterana TaxID=132249 RepID=A0A7X6LWB3_9NOCA|nr:ornithine cyclodeaminase family protein [Nocardia veterana]NKY85800.1 ornithine cyclodeaminase family protein [Nocardia veterana]